METVEVTPDYLLKIIGIQQVKLVRQEEIEQALKMENDKLNDEIKKLSESRKVILDNRNE
ncbi:MAG: hypothetical protein KAS32_01040 [Candidatus Peribacteraceae bacterium]|nr:hypothetical protein [Candidatus Peribacteraceae bacterium]